MPTAVDTLHLSASLREQLERWSRASAPHEACGALIGVKHDGVVQVQSITLAENVAESSARFEVDPGHVVRVTDEAAARTQHVLGIWHSHIDAPAMPSHHDDPRNWPGSYHLIVGIHSADAQSTAWKACGSELEPIELA